jgi:hypothetical protein
LDNSSTLKGNKLTVKNADVTTEGNSNCSLFVETNIIVEAVEKSEIEILGAPKIEIRKFEGEAKLLKKLK